MRRLAVGDRSRELVCLHDPMYMVDACIVKGKGASKAPARIVAYEPSLA
jgi:hypothetical protein